MSQGLTPVRVLVCGSQESAEAERAQLPAGLFTKVMERHPVILGSRMRVWLLVHEVPPKDVQVAPATA